MAYGNYSFGSESFGSTDTTADTLGTEGEITVIIENEEINTFTDIEIEKRLNEVDTFSFQAFITDSKDRSLINEGNDVKIIEGSDNLLFKGRLTEVEYKSNFRAECEGDGMEVKLLNRKTGRETFTNTAANSIVNQVVNYGESVEKGVVETGPNVSLRFDHDNKARAVAGAANAVGFDWYISQKVGEDFDNDYLNFVSDAGGTATEKIEKTFTEYDTVKNLSVTGNSTLGVPERDSYQEDLETEPPKKVVYEFTPTEYDTSNGDNETKYFFKNTPNDQVPQMLAIPHDTQTIELSNNEDEAEIRFSSGRKDTGISVPVNQKVEVELTFNYSSQTYDAVITTGGSTYEFNGLKLSTKDTANNETFDPRIINTAVFEVVLESSGTASAESTYLETTGEIQQTYELDIGRNAELVERNKDEGFIANDITLLGRGDGINQLESNVFAATTKYTDTTQVVTENETTSFNIQDATQLGSTGDFLTVRIGSEPVEVTISDNTTLSIDSRAVNNYKGDSTEPIKHYEGVRVWLVENKTQNIGPFTPENKSTAETGSSIDTFGVKEQRETDKTIVDISTLEKTADLELKNRFEDVFRIKVRASDPRVTQNIGLGDQVKVKDLTAMNVDDLFDVVGFDVKRASSEEGTVLHLANRPRRLTERLSDIERDRNTLNAHMQGATNLAPLNFNDNADNPHPLTANLRVPKDAVAVNKVDVAFKRESFRGYVQNQAHSHETNPVIDQQTGERALEHTHATSTGEFTNDLIQIPTPTTSFNYDSNSESLFIDVPLQPSGSFNGADVTINWFNNSGVGQDFGFDLKDETGSVLRSESNINTPNNESKSFNYALSSNEVSVGETLTVVFTEGANETDSAPSQSSYVRITVNSSSSKSSDSSIGSSKTSEEAGNPAYGIFEPSNEPDVDVGLIVDGNTVNTFSNVSVGDEIGPVDVKSYLSTPLAGEYHEIKLVPVDTGGGNNGRCRLNTDVNGKIFIESTL